MQPFVTIYNIRLLTQRRLPAPDRFSATNCGMNRNGTNTGVVDGAIVEKESASFLGEYQGIIMEGDEPDSMASTESKRKRTRSVAEPASSNTTHHKKPNDDQNKRKKAEQKREARGKKKAKAAAKLQALDLRNLRSRCSRRVDKQIIWGAPTNTHAVSPPFNAGTEITASAHRLGARTRSGQDLTKIGQDRIASCLAATRDVTMCGQDRIASCLAATRDVTINGQTLTMKVIARESILQDELLAIYKAEQKRSDEAHALRVRDMDFLEGRSAQLHDREGTGARSQRANFRPPLFSFVSSTNSFSAAPSTALALPAVSPAREETAIGQYQVNLAPSLPQLPARNADYEDEDDWSTHLNSPALENLPAGSYVDDDFMPLPLVPTPALENEYDVHGRHENRPGSAEHQGLVADQVSPPSQSEERCAEYKEQNGGVYALSVYTEDAFELLVEPILSPTASEREEQ
jgi:hypothetical protein